MVSTSAVAYAQEVYAACATVGYDGPLAIRLKKLLDKHQSEPETVLDEDLVLLAQRAHLDAVAWLNR